MTDTNQASEDKLRAEILTEFKQVYKLAPDDYTDNCTNVVMSIIRTEKLKLLAEVRERVVGDNFKNWGELDTDEQAIQDCLNRLKDDQRTALTKLEAEL